MLVEEIFDGPTFPDDFDFENHYDNQLNILLVRRDAMLNKFNKKFRDSPDFVVSLIAAKVAQQKTVKLPTGGYFLKDSPLVIEALALSTKIKQTVRKIMDIEEELGYDRRDY